MSADDVFDLGQDFESKGKEGIASRHDFVHKSASDQVLSVDGRFVFDDFFRRTSEEGREEHRERGGKDKKEYGLTEVNVYCMDNIMVNRWAWLEICYAPDATSVASKKL